MTLDRQSLEQLVLEAKDPLSTKARAETFLRKILTDGTEGIKHDSDWRAVYAIFGRLTDAGFRVQKWTSTSTSEYYKIPNSSNMNDGKRWTFEVPFPNGKGGWYVSITASFAGSAQDPSDAYDITVTLDYSARIQMQESLDEKSPPGWEGTVKAMKKHPEITNPWALAWAMKNKGMKPHYKLNKRKQPVKKEESYDYGFYVPEAEDAEDLRDDLYQRLVKAGLAARVAITTCCFYVGQNSYGIYGRFLEYKGGRDVLFDGLMKGSDVRASTRKGWLAQAVRVIVANEKLLDKRKQPVKTEEMDLEAVYEPDHGELAELRDDLVAALKKAGLKDADDSVTINGFSVGNQPYAIHGHFLSSQRGPKMKGEDLRAATRADWLKQAVPIVVAHQKLLRKQPVKTTESTGNTVSEDEQEDGEELERLAGGSAKAFKLMRLWTASQQSASGNAFTLSTGGHVDPVAVFVKRAKADGYKDAAIEHYVTRIAGEDMPKKKSGKNESRLRNAVAGLRDALDQLK